jgi:hypothetical protein
MLFPVFHLFKFILDNKAFEVTSSQSSDPLTIDILALSHGIDMKVVLMNFTNDIHSVMLKDIYGDFSMKQLTAGNFSDAVSDLKWYKNTSSIKLENEEKFLM